MLKMLEDTGLQVLPGLQVPLDRQVREVLQEAQEQTALQVSVVRRGRLVLMEVQVLPEHEVQQDQMVQRAKQDRKAQPVRQG